MATAWRRIPLCMFVAGCGLERDWAAWQMASASATADSTGSSGSSSTSGTDPGSDTSDTGSIASTTSAAASTSETSGAVADTSESGNTTTASTGESAICGDGVVDPPEECDDGNAVENDRCTGDCLKIRLAFVTSIIIQGDLNSEVNADAQCKSLAAKAMQADPLSPITNASNFKVLLPFSNKTVFERHYHGAGPYQLVNGLRVSDSFDELFTAPHQNPINVDERSMTRHWGVWTGMTADGLAYPGVDLCKDWTSLSGTAAFGDADSVDGWWLYADVAGNPTIDCGYEFALYCLEQE